MDSGTLSVAVKLALIKKTSTLVLKMNTVRCLRNLFTLFLKAVLEFWLSQISVETLGKIIFIDVLIFFQLLELAESTLGTLFTRNKV